MEWVTVNFLLKVLGVIALLVLFRPAEKFFKNLVRAHAGHFEPYRVWIEPNWFQLLLDYGLVKDLDEWHEVWARIDHIPASDYDVLRDGISFTVLKPDLIYRDDHKKFSTSVKFEEPIMEVSLLHSGGWEYHPRIYIGFAGYAIKSLPEGAYGISVTPADSAK